MKKSAVENRGADRSTWNGDPQLRDHYDKAYDVAGLNAGQLVTVDTGAPNETAVCAVVRAKNSDRFGRSNPMGVVLLMSSVDAKALVQEIASSPDVLFTAIQQRNGGPIQRFDGTPAEMDIPQKLEVLPPIAAADTRTSYKGKSTQTSSSSPFPPNYKPW